MFQQERDVYILNEETSPNRLCSVLFIPVAKNKTVPSPVSLLRFVYDEEEARKRCQEAGDIAGEVARFLAEHATVDTQAGTVRVESHNTQTVFQLTEQKMFFISFPNGEFSVQAVPKGIAEVSVLGVKESGIDYLYKKEKEHGGLFDSFLIAEECKREDRWKSSRIRNIPRKRNEASLLLSFLTAKEFQLDLEATKDMYEEENKSYLKIPYGIGLFVTEENICCLEPFDLTDTRIKKLVVTSFDITRMNLKNTTIEELLLVDEMAVEFFYNSIGRSELCVEKLSFGNKISPQSEKVLKLIKWVNKGENVTQRKIKMLVLNKNNFFAFLEEANRIVKRKIHLEELIVEQNGKDNGPKTETSTRIVVSKKINIRGNVRVLRFIELGPELNHLDINEFQRQCRSPEIDIPRINMTLKETKISLGENMQIFQFLKKNITATEVCFFTGTGKKALEGIKLTFVSEELENLCFRTKGLSVLSSITNKKINVVHLAVMDTVKCFSDQEKEEIRKKTFVIREKLYMRNTGIFFMVFLGENNFIPVIEIEVNCFTGKLGGFEKTTGIHIETNALLGKISPGIKSVWKIKQKIREMITQKEPVVKAFSIYQKLVFEEDIEYEEKHEQAVAKLQEFKEDIGMDICRYWFSRHLTDYYED
ncbi:MAG: uncharacterized protein A8A55_2211 [Amphiamblys sp. WSBS2006]|nr:MAG: uncharacterized protein A8A55_2211 [Amphiamblys sp. WSBS2006]